MNFCHQFLDFVAASFPKTDADPREHFIFEFDPKGRSVWRRPASSADLVKRNILPEWYLQAMRQNFQ